MDDNCLFCKIIKGEIPSSKVYEDELVYGFKDINPESEIHYLFVPKKHIPTICYLTNEDDKYVLAIHKAMNKVAKEQGFIENGYRVKVIGEDVKHLHYHQLAGQTFGDKII